MLQEVPETDQIHYNPPIQGYINNKNCCGTLSDNLSYVEELSCLEEVNWQSCLENTHSNLLSCMKVMQLQPITVFIGHYLS